MKVAVIGLGKIGLPLACFVASAAVDGLEVVGCDINRQVVDMVNSGQEPFTGETGLAKRLASAIASGALRATSSLDDAVGLADVVLVAIPLLTDEMGSVLFENLFDLAKQIGGNIKRGALIVFETTMPIGTVRTQLTPILSDASGYELGEDLFVAYSPERVYSGNIFKNLEDYPKVVGGVDEESNIRAVDFYNLILGGNSGSRGPSAPRVLDLASSDAAEFVKLAETTYRDVNIALANQFAIHAERLGVDVYKVIEACNTQPFSHIHQPGIAVGGHCIPVYPHFYLMGDADASVVALSRQVNLSMPMHVVESIKARLGSIAGLRVAVLGLAYRGGVKEHAFSGALSLVALLEMEGAYPEVHDPMYTEEDFTRLGLREYHLGTAIDVAILQANHAEYLALTPDALPVAKLLVDGRNFTSAGLRASVPTYVLGIGSP